jgi:broad specificity phosphatase PhoE
MTRLSDRVRVWCLRHAESENVTNGTAGAVPAAPLTARGHRQALDAARVLADEPITRVYSSTAMRARQTAGHLAADLGVTAMPELVEVGIGTHEGTSDPAIRARTAEVLHAWVVEQDLEQRVADGETGHQVVARVTAAFQKIAGAHRGETVAVVGHVAGLTVTLGRLCVLGSRVWGTPLPHARPFLVVWDGHAWHCPAWPGAAGPPLPAHGS